MQAWVHTGMRGLVHMLLCNSLCAHQPGTDVVIGLLNAYVLLQAHNRSAQSCRANRVAVTARIAAVSDRLEQLQQQLPLLKGAAAGGTTRGTKKVGRCTSVCLSGCVCTTIGKTCSYCPACIVA